MRCMHEVNRGGLKILKNEAFDFFKLVEISVYHHITQSSSTEQVDPDPESIVQHLLQDVDLQFLWCMLTVVGVWIKVRGHSYAADLAEKYKWATLTQTRKAKGTRKALEFHE